MMGPLSTTGTAEYELIIKLQLILIINKVMEEVDKKSHNSEENNEEEDFDPLGEDFSV